MTHGNYYVYGQLTVRNPGGQAKISASVSTVSFHLTRTVDNRKSQYGIDGFMTYKDAGQYIHYTTDTGLSLKGAMDIPGLLLSGTISWDGYLRNMWGLRADRVRSEKQSNGRYKVYHDIGHSEYSISVTSHARSWQNWTAMASIISRTSSYFEVFFRDDKNSETDCGFDFQLYGHN